VTLINRLGAIITEQLTVVRPEPVTERGTLNHGTGEYTWEIQAGQGTVTFEFRPIVYRS